MHSARHARQTPRPARRGPRRLPGSTRLLDGHPLEPADDIDRYLVDAPSTSPGSSTAPTAPGRPGSRPTSSTPGSNRPPPSPTKSWSWDDASSMTPAARPLLPPGSSPPRATPAGLRTPATSTTPTSRPACSTSLETTAPGCAWLLDRWDDLRELVDGRPDVAGAGPVPAIRLLGKQPLGMMDDERVRMDPPGCDARWTPGQVVVLRRDHELYPGEPERMNQWIAARDPKREVPADAEVAARRCGIGVGGRGAAGALLARGWSRETAAAEAGWDSTTRPKASVCVGTSSRATGP